MTITNISRSKSYEMVTPFGLKIWDKLGVEATLGENEDPKEGYKILGELIEETHKENLRAWETEPVRQVEPHDKIDGWIQVINLCTSVKALEIFRVRVEQEKNEELTQAYNIKLQSLQK